MADELSNHLPAELRTQFGKGAARKIRALGTIPAVVYGHGTDPQHITLPGHEVGLLLRKANQVLELEIGGKEQLALVKDVQKDPVRQLIEHIDLIVVRKGEKVTVDIPVHVEGEPFSGTMAVLDATTISIEVEATHIPENVVVSVEGLHEGSHILAKDVPLPKGAALLSDPELLVVGISGTRSAASDAEEAADEAAAEAASEAAAEAVAEAAAEDAE